VIDHLWIRVHDLDASKHLYTAIAPTLGITARERPSPARLQLICDSGTFSLVGDSPTTENLHLAIGVSDNETVHRFHQAALESGGHDHGGPGERPQYHPDYYAAYVLDPGANNLEAVCHNQFSQFPQSHLAPKCDDIASPSPDRPGRD
jgi:catechol 2,3-dioxygenase-like lactoylglutathione lyase family enzyme